MEEAGMTESNIINGGVGFIRRMPIGFLHRLFRRNDGVKDGDGR